MFLTEVCFVPAEFQTPDHQARSLAITLTLFFKLCFQHSVWREIQLSKGLGMRLKDKMIGDKLEIHIS
jgi:hypothetical protein